MASIFFLSASLYSFQRFTQASVMGPAIPATAASPGSARLDVLPDSMKARNFSFTVTSRFTSSLSISRSWDSFMLRLVSDVWSCWMMGFPMDLASV
jgi:hypothetical protein